MDERTIISPEEARSILRKFDAPSSLLEEGELIDIINRVDSIAYLYITGIREKSEPQRNATQEAQPLN